MWTEVRSFRERFRPVLAALLISLLASALLLGLRGQGLLQPLELAGYDLGLALRPPLATPSSVTLIEITEADIQNIGRWPVTDRFLLEVIERLEALEPRAIGLDIYRDVPVPPGTAELERRFLASERIIGVLKFHTDSSPGVAGPPPLVAADRVGFSDFVLDPDGLVRRGLAFLDDGETVAWSFALKLALEFLRPEGVGIRPYPEEPAHFRVGPTLIAPMPERFGAYVDVDNAGYQFLVDHKRGAGSLPTFTVAELLAGAVPPASITDRVVIFGVHAESVKDSFVTPRTRWPWVEDPQVAGIALHGLIVDQLVRAGMGLASPMDAPGTGPEAFLLVAACLAGGMAGLLAGSAVRLSLIILVGVIGITLSGFLVFSLSYWLPVFPMAAGWTGTAALVTAYLVQQTRVERRALRRILDLQVSETVAGEIWRRREELLEGGRLKPETLRATVMFVDLQGFTEQTEALSSDALLTWLNPFLTLATETILAHGGMVDDYFGDGIKANFGVPFARTSDDEVSQDAVNAVRCAAALIQQLAVESSDPNHPYVLRIGIHSGPVVAATVGSRSRSKYTSVGDTVNVAARLESLAKELDMPGLEGTPCQVVASQQTVRLAGEDFCWQPLGEVRLKGRAGPVEASILQSCRALG